MKTNNLNFYGYRNVLSHQVNTNNTSCSYIAMEFDNLHENDLDAFEKLKCAAKDCGKVLTGDKVVIINYNAHGNDFMYINGAEITPSYVLSECKGKDPVFMKEEAFTLKSYKFVTDLMKRLQFDRAIYNDKGIIDVARHTLEEFSRWFPHRISWEYFVEPSFLSYSTNRIAEDMLKKISTNMLEYFRK